MSLALALIAALMLTTTAFAQAPTDSALYASTTRINMLPGTSSYTLTTNLTAGATQNYLLGISAGQTLYILKTGSASVSVLDPQGMTLASGLAQPGPWSIAAEQTGDYTVVLNGQGPVTLSVYIPPFYSGQEFASILPYFRSRIQFGIGSVSYSFRSYFIQGVPQAYVLNIGAGQQLTVTAQGNLTVAVLDPQNNVLPASSLRYGQWQFSIPQTGDYTVVGLGSGVNLLSFYIPPTSGGVPPSAPIPVHFAPGAVSASVFPNLIQGQPATQYSLGIGAGQTLYVSATANVSSVQVFDPQGANLTGSRQGNGSLAFYIGQTGNYTVVVYGSGSASITFYIPPMYGSY